MKIFAFLKLIKKHLNGDLAYENYLLHHRENHQQEQTLSKKDFFLKQQNDKWQKVNRCC